MKSQKYVTVLALLNAMLTRISTSLPQIEEATRGLYSIEVPPALRVGANTSSNPNV
jgi:hypothetical protein